MADDERSGPTLQGQYPVSYFPVRPPGKGPQGVGRLVDPAPWGAVLSAPASILLYPAATAPRTRFPRTPSE
jgi:hypothetical protein